MRTSTECQIMKGILCQAEKVTLDSEDNGEPLAVLRYFRKTSRAKLISLGIKRLGN